VTTKQISKCGSLVKYTRGGYRPCESCGFTTSNCL